MSLTDILLIILLIMASALCIALIYYLWRISESVKAMRTDLSNLSEKLQPLITSTSELAKNLSEIAENAKGHFDISKDIVSSVKDRVDTILEFEEKVRRGIEGPLTAFFREVTALSNGLRTFLSYFKKKDI